MNPSAQRVKLVTLEPNRRHAGVLYAAPAWEPARGRPAARFGSSLYRRVYLVGFTKQVSEELRALLPHGECAWLGKGEGHGEGQGLAECYGEVAQACLAGLRQALEDGTQRRTLVQVVIADGTRESLLIGLSGMLKSAAIENPRVRGQVLLAGADMTAAKLAERLLAESGGSTDGVIRYEAGHRQVLRLREIEAAASAPPAFKHQGVYLITGGLGGLGILFAQEILRQAGAARIVLTGRSPLDEDKQRQLQALREQGGNVEYRQLDVADAPQVQQLIDSFAAGPQLNGIIHAAGVRSDSFLLKKTAAELATVLAPKVAGALNLDEATRDLELDFLVLFSSGAAVMGNAGQADYAAANGFLDQFARYRNERVTRGERHGKTLSINWPLWQHGGMNVDVEIQEWFERTFGIRPLSTGDGMRAFHAGLASSAAQMLVLTGDIPKLRTAVLDARANTAVFSESEMEDHLTALFSLPAS